MKELLKLAMAGWQDFTTDGKLPALLLISLVFLWIYYKRVNQKHFLIYTTVSAVCCLVPVTAVVLMLYQTRFYDYEWVWSIVPLTAMIAFGAIVFVTDFLKEFTGADKKREAAVIVLMLGALVLCSGLGERWWDGEKERQERRRAEELLAGLKEQMGEEEIYLWAPREVLAYARECDSEIKLLYGRNMWDISLNAYAYDVYSEELVSMEAWMSGEKDAITDKECAEKAAETDVNCVLLPEYKSEETVALFEKYFDTNAVQFGNYYLLIR